MSWDVRRWWAKNVLRRAVDLDLSHVGIPAILMIANDRYLNHKRPNGPIINILNRNHYPPAWLIQVHHLYLLQIIEVGPSSDAYPENQ